MNERIKPWLKAMGSGLFLSSILTVGTGCGAIKAAANPKVAWAVSDPAPMAVVVRRADAADGTSKEVDRLLTSTPAGADSQWVQKTAPSADEQKANGDAVANHELYVQSQARIVPAEIWLRTLPKLKDDAPAPPDAPAATTPPAPDPQVADSGKKASKPGKTAKGGKPKKGDKADKPADAKDAQVAKSDAPATTTLTSADVPAAPAAGHSASLVAAIDKDLADKYAVVMAKKKEIADLKGQIAVEETAADEKGISDADKKAHKDTIAGLEKKVDAAEGEADKLAKEFIPAAKAAAQKATPEVKEKFGPTLVALRQAVDDADVSNSAAAIKYPMAVPTIKDSATQMLGVYVSDVIEEKTGKRPTLAGFQPGLTLDGTKVQVTLNGLAQDDLGKLSAADVTKEVADREQKWVKHAVTLMGAIASNKEILGFEHDVLDALIGGMEGNGWKAPAAPQITCPPPAKPKPQGAPKKA
jgi:hypothetical protein